MALNDETKMSIAALLYPMDLSELFQILTIVEDAINRLSGSPYESLLELDASSPPSERSGLFSALRET